MTPCCRPAVATIGKENKLLTRYFLDTPNRMRYSIYPSERDTMLFERVSLVLLICTVYDIRPCHTHGFVGCKCRIWSLRFLGQHRGRSQIPGSMILDPLVEKSSTINSCHASELTFEIQAHVLNKHRAAGTCFPWTCTWYSRFWDPVRSSMCSPLANIFQLCRGLIACGSTQE